MIENFLEYISVEKRYAQHTVTSYRKDLEDFAVFVLETEATNDLKKADKKTVRNFIIHLSEKKLSKRSINRKLSSIRSFYKYLLKIREVEVSPIETINSLKFYPEKQIPLSEEEADELLMILNDKKTVILDKTILETLYQTGMRKHELCQLKINDLDISKSELQITGKGNKQRIIPVSKKLLQLFKEYLQVRKPRPDAENLFFVNDKGKKLTEKFVYSKVNSYLSLITSKKKKSPHILRHSFATHVLDGGAEISKVKKIMGHSSLASTQVYTNANIEQLKKVFNKAHPRANKSK